MSKMEDRLDKLADRLEEINNSMMDPAVVSDRRSMAKLGREANELTLLLRRTLNIKRQSRLLRMQGNWLKKMIKKSVRWHSWKSRNWSRRKKN